VKNATKPTDVSAHQTVTDFIRLETANETIQIGFTDQKISGRAGLLTFAGFLQWHRFGELLARVMPQLQCDMPGPGVKAAWTGEPNRIGNQPRAKSPPEIQGPPSLL
jgi:hypothetical protein